MSAWQAPRHRPACRAGMVAVLMGMGLGLGVSNALAADRTAARVLTGKDVNEANIVDELAPPAVTTRTLSVRPAVSLLITFKTNSAELTPAALQQLAVVGSAIKNERLLKYNFSVEGHADPRGNAATNLALSQRRAESVRKHLLSSHGVQSQRLVAEGKGDLEVINRDNPAAPENRRVTFATRW